MRMMYFLPLIILVFSCSTEKTKEETQKKDNSTLKTPSTKEEHAFYEFTPNVLSDTEIKLKDFKLRKAFGVDNLKILIGQYTNENINHSKDDLEDYGGIRLLALNSKNEIIYKSRGGGDIYSAEPHFYKNNYNNKTLIVCQLSFEYYCGGDIYLVEKNKVKFIGNLDIESNNMDISLTDILQIKENQDQIIFSFKSDSLLLEPGGKNERIVKNNGIKYIYKDNIMTPSKK